MKKNWKSIIIVFFALLLILGLSSCKFFEEVADALTSVGGLVVDARDQNLAPIEGATVQLINSSGTLVSQDTTDINGRYVLDYDSEGEYTIQASLDGYVIIPRKHFYVGGWVQTVPNLLALSYDYDSDIAIVAIWEDDFADIDTYLSYPADSGTGSANYGVENFSALEDLYVSTFSMNGFGPSDTSREKRFHSSTDDDTTFDDLYSDSDTTPLISLDRDDRDGAGPETMVIRAAPYFYSGVSAFTMTGNGDFGLPASTDTYVDGGITYTYGNWGCVGIMEYYVDSYCSTRSDTDGDGLMNSNGTPSGLDAPLDEANVHVFVTQGANIISHAVLGETQISAQSVYRIGMFESDISQDSYLLFYPHEQMLAADTSYLDIRSAVFAGEKAPVLSLPMGRVHK